MPKAKLYRRPDGLYEKKLTINGKRIAFRAKTEREVMQKIAAYQQRAERGVTFAEAAAEWWDQHEKKIRYGTVHGYKAAMRRAVEYFGNDPVRRIEAADVNAFLQFMAKRGYAQKTVRNQLTVVRQIFLYALMARQIKVLPTDGVTIPSGLSHNVRTLAPVDAVETIRDTQPDDFLLPALILYTGARCGEALALQWRDIDFEASTISITKAVVHHSNRPVISETKTEKGVRIVPLLAPLRGILDQRGHGQPADYLIGGGAPISKSALYKRWEGYCRAHGLAHRDEARSAKAGRTVWACDLDRHTLRHEYATILYDAGIDAKVAQELLGHADLSITLKIYTHIRQRRIQDAASILDSYLTPKGTEKAQ